MTEPDEPTDTAADLPDRPTLATPGPAVMRETLASARRRLVHDDLADDLPRTAAELRAALRDAALPDKSGPGHEASRRSTSDDRTSRALGPVVPVLPPPPDAEPEATA